ncbi:MAG: SDR family oxidoreductase [Proteobacteria bacterium]|jgi:NAD(P)-dependent dehydrogenase (short-subunit alcohol dehydrogenase family)|nr:3-oxoacyl-ACP reductase [Methylibium sp.]MBY0365493.1 SDR family oxidoreductase [Burkholderiaceae bacterium]MCH8856591.1 SDR family oxidoreductase [Pseudomonadota bacterium]|mmetsp:Transcript_5196/g.19335  ORF Transcript_5196/g.19335 Transcript_5196/m.19335 type:complete len:242 (+) Transcript_5196:2574-3299(+)
MKVALVTGAGSGIGRAVARALAGEGWTLALLGRREASLRETLPQALLLPADVADEAQVGAAFATLRERLGRLDLLFNNAGISAPPLPIDELSPAQWRAVVDTNLTGSFLCARAAFALMKVQSPRGGRIINNGSISAHSPRPFSAPYTATKHAITGLTKALSLDGRAHDIACGQIDIGNAATDMTQRMRDGILQPNGQIAVEPTMDVEDVARAVTYMASLPLSANVQQMTVMARDMPFVGRG